VTVTSVIRFVLRPFMSGWPDAGRRIVQRPQLRKFLDHAVKKSRRFPHAFNAGAGEGGYSPLLLGLPDVQIVAESDIGWRVTRPRRIDRRQLFFCSSLTSIPLPDERFDFILCTEVLEHIAEHEHALDEIARVTAPGGWLLVTVPTPPAIRDRMHAREGYRPEEFAAMLTRRGFEVIDTGFCMYFFFRLVLEKWPTVRWRPHILICGLALLDNLLPIGPPMDLMILARMRTNTRLRPDPVQKSSAEEFAAASASNVGPRSA
jgi:SAM-dependent methyltransferase